MNSQLRAAIYILAAAFGSVALIYGWISNEQADAWLRVVDSFLNVVVIVAPLLALKHLTPDATPEEREDVSDGMAS